MAHPWGRREVLRAGLVTGLAAAGVVANEGNASALNRASHNGAVVYASDFGFDPIDSTAALQAALDSTADTVVVDNVGANWITGPLSVNRNNVTIIVERGVVLAAKVGAFPSAADCLWSIIGRSHVNLVGYGATCRMNKPEYTTGEWRHALQVLSSDNISVEGLTFSGSGGDGIYLGRSTSAGMQSYSSQITLRDVHCHNSRRNALSVVSVDGLLVEGSLFSHSAGTNPRAGVDFEPNGPTDRIANIIVRDCVFENNYNYGVVLSLHGLSATSQPLSLLFDRIRIGPQVSHIPSFLYSGLSDDDPGSIFEMRDSLIETSPYSGSIGVWKKAVTTSAATLRRTVIWNWGNTYEIYPPINLQPGGLAEYGGIDFSDVVLYTDQAPPFLKVQNESSTTLGVRSLHGNITVVAPSVPTMSLGKGPADITLAVRHLPAAPASSVTLATTTPTVPAGGAATITFTRTSPDLKAPLAVRFSCTGTAIERDDYRGLSGHVVIPPGQTSTTLTVSTRQSGRTGSADIVVNMVASAAYTIGSPSSVGVTINYP